ncbi:GSCOCG00003046001-RA-CDS [Cotesia congregata]|nr:GSCOCG00003046001-RA-CDS [Cotesia congregata]
MTSAHVSVALKKNCQKKYLECPHICVTYSNIIITCFKETISPVDFLNFFN